jgi:bis(5'-nucleosyl)-tetraphosphatase (symmetrical)
LREKGAPDTQSNGFIPWFEVAKRASRNDRIIFGHWSTLGYYQADNLWCLDSGCLWGESSPHYGCANPSPRNPFS